MPRLRPDFWRTFRPGAAEVPAADADMLRTDNASTTTVPWLLAMAVLYLWRKSLRAFATRCFRGRPVTSPPRVAGRRSASSANTSNNNLHRTRTHTRADARYAYLRPERPSLRRE